MDDGDTIPDAPDTPTRAPTRAEYRALYGEYRSYKIRAEKRIDELEVKVMDMIEHIRCQCKRNHLLQDALDKAQARIAAYQAKEME
jgi:hypothetical protein